MSSSINRSRIALEILQAMFFCLTLIVTPTLAAAENPVGTATIQQLVDINTADAETLAEVMDGVGVVKAQEIVAYREQHGKFQTLEQLLEVRGIGMATLERNRDRITVISQ
jgi:competence protein ComEA